jgi:hypothetical protein
MKPEQQKKLLFHQICDGDLARDAQLEFERMQKMTLTHGVKTTMVIKITVYPNDVKKGMPLQFGELDYEVSPAVIKRKSERYVAEIKDGLIIGDGKSITDVLQEELFPDDFEGESNTINFQKEESNGQ